MNTQSKYLHFVAYKILRRWDIKSYLATQYSSQYRMVALGQYIREESQKYTIRDKDTTYGILGVNNQTGIFDAYEESGAKINQKYKRMEIGWIAYNPYRVNVGSIGIKREAHKYEYISPAYVVFSCKEGLLPEYLFMLMKTPTFNKIIRENTTGSVRQNLSYDNLSTIQIPLPSLAKQQALVDAYNRDLQQATELEQKAQNGEKEIENAIMQKLGISIPQTEIHKKGLSFVSYKNVQDRWDLYNAQTSIFAALAKANYRAQQIGSVYSFITRSWKKTEEKFRYIELGSVDAADGIQSATELLVKDAPSRATQKVVEGDLILGTTRPYLKKFAIVPQEFADCVCSSGFQVIANNSTNNLQFLYEYLKTPAAIAQYEYFMTGALYPAITNADLKKVEIPLPPLDVQAEIVAEVQAQRVKIAEYKTTAVTLRKDAITQFEQAIFE